MGKTPKKAAPGGDERHLYVRRLKATTATSKASESSLTERQRDSENSHRPKPTGIQKKVVHGPAKNFKSKLRAPAKVGLAHTSKQLKITSSYKEVEETPAIPLKTVQIKLVEMQPESEEAEVKRNASTEKEDAEVPNKSNEVNVAKNEETKEEPANHVAVTEEKADSKTDSKTEEINTVAEAAHEQNNGAGCEDNSQQNVSGHSRKGEEHEEHEENDIKLNFDTEEIIEETSHEKQQETITEGTNKPQESSETEAAAMRNESDACEKEDVQSDVQTDAESCSVDIVESTTSELSEVSEVPSQNDAQKEREKSVDPTNEASFVNYDSSIMLKDVKIQLNDCLKDNSKLFDVSNAEHDTPSHPSRDMSFGKTLRNISGRHSLNRMRHVTLREQRISPNNSLFVNTSNMSLAPDETSDFKILRYSYGVSDNLSTNGTPVDRKRKLDADAWNSAKKQKTESENSLFNTSISLLKGLRRPVQVSTPNAETYKFKSSKLNISGLSDDESKMINEPIGTPKKWCVLM